MRRQSDLSPDGSRTDTPQLGPPIRTSLVSHKCASDFSCFGGKRPITYSLLGNMTTVDVLQLLLVAYSGAKEERTQATAQLSSAFSSPDASQYLLQLLQAGTNPSIPAEQSLSALIYAKNCLLHSMDDALLSSNPQLLQEAQRVLFSGVFTVPESHRKIICACTMSFISSFNWNYLPELMPMVGADLANTTAEHSAAVLSMLHTYTKRFKTPGLEPMALKMKVCLVLVSTLPHYLTYNDFRVSKLVFKVMECVVETALELTKQSEMPSNALDPWFTAMMNFISQNYSSAVAAGGKAYDEYVKCVKRIAMISYSVLNDATRRKKPAPVAAHFLAAHAAGLLNVLREWLQTCVTNHSETHRASEMFAIRFVKLCTLDEGLYRRYLRPQAISLIESLLFPYLCYGEEDEEIFSDEDGLSEYVQYMIDEGIGSGELSPRQAAANAILALIGGKKTFHDPALLSEVLQALTVGLSMETTVANGPRLFGFLGLLSILRKYLRQDTTIWQTQMAQVLMQFVAPRLHASVPMVWLRCKAMVVCQRYSKVPMPSPQDFASFVQLMGALVEDKDPRVRLAAIDAMCTLLEMKVARPYMVSVLVPLMEECIGFLNRVQTTFVPTVILHLATHFAPELTAVMGTLGHTLVQHFLATAFEMEQQEADDINELDIRHYERAAFSADAILDALLTVVIACSENSDALNSMRSDILSLVRSVLEKPDTFDFMDKTLGIFLHVVNFSKPIPPDCWSLLPLLFASVDSGIGVDFFNTIEEVLDNFVSGAPVEFLSNQTLMESTFHICRKMLVGGVVCNPECQMAPSQLIEAMLHQAKACPNPGLFLPYLARYVGLLLQTLIHPDIQAAEDIRIRVWALTALMDCFYYNAEATLDVIVEANAYPQFFDGLLHFYRGCLQPEESNVAKKGGRRKKTRDEAQEVVEALSILTRKVMIIGLSSLLGFISAPSSVSHPCYATFHGQYESSIAALVQYCIFTNYQLYAARTVISKENIERIRGGVEDEVEDVDPSDEQVLGVDGGDDTFDDLSEADDWGGEQLGLGHDEGDDYESPIDEINEVSFFTAWLAALPQYPDDSVKAQTLSLLRTEAEYVEATRVATEYRALCQELERAMKEDYQTRQVAAGQ